MASLLWPSFHSRQKPTRRKAPVTVNARSPLATLRDFYKSHYDLEIVRKTDLTAALSIPVGVLSLLVGALVILAKELHVPLSNPETLQAVALAISAAASLTSGYFLFRSLYDFAYGYVATPLEIHQYYVELAAFHKANGVADPDAKSLAEEETLDYIDTEYAKYADRNSKNNDIKSTYLHRANGAMVAAVLCASVGAGAYIWNSIISAATISKVEVVNLKGLNMPTLSIPAATVPSPSAPPQPQPKVDRPSPPPGRVIKEDQRPPRPQDPPRR